MLLLIIEVAEMVDIHTYICFTSFLHACTTTKFNIREDRTRYKKN